MEMGFREIMEAWDRHPEATFTVLLLLAVYAQWRTSRQDQREMLSVARESTALATKLAEGVSALERMTEKVMARL